MNQENVASQDFCIYNLIATRARSNPDAIALVAPGRAPLSYGNLHEQINKIAATLNAMGAGRNDRVAIALPNGPEMAIAFLATASAATCAPLNPAYTLSEFDFYLSDLNAKALIVQSGIDSIATAAARERGIPIIELAPVLHAEAGIFTLSGSQTAPPDRTGFAEPDDIALVLHTSGTTSRPKIVPLTHRNLCTSAQNIRAALHLTEGDRCLNVMPLFHIHGLIAALLSSLNAGASVVCTPGFFAPKFFEWLDEFRPTWYSAVPTMHQAILSRAAANREIIARTPIRFIRSSSAALPPPVMAELEKTFNAPVIEAYGMTEASHQMASNPLPPKARKQGSVGVAAGPEIAIMDEAGHLLSAGEIGEIVIRGANVTVGYENNPKANESAFTNSWFRTGDQGYLDSDGYLFIKGRLKEIINRGGEKISPREVDEVLLNHPAVAQVVTFAMPHPTLGEDVGAAVVLRENTTATEREIQEFASAQLADFKVPRRVIFLAEIPKGPTGKLQRIGLAEKLGIGAGEREQARTAFAPPGTIAEEQLAQIWAEVLGVEKVGVRDNFFELGGDSILAAQILNRARSQMRVELSFLDFWENPTVAGMAAEATRQQAQPIAPISPIPETGERPLSLTQTRMWFLERLEPGNPVYNRPVAIRLTGELNEAALEQSLNEIVRRHEVFRSSFPAADGLPVVAIAPTLTVPLSVADLSHLAESDREAEVLRLAAECARRPFDLERGPLVRANLWRLNASDRLLLVEMHHIIFDGWSFGIFQKELAAFYEAFATGKPSPFPELSVQYADFAQWQRQWLQGNVLDAQLAYWKKQLEGANFVLDLPSDRSRAAVQTFRGARHVLTLPPTLSESLKTFSQREKVTLFAVLLAAFGALLSRYSGQEDILIGSPVAGRNRVEVENAIGLFANTLVLRLRLEGNPAFTELLERSRQAAFGALAHQELPFEKLVEHLQPQRDTSRTPLFQVMFQLRNVPNETVQVDGLKFEEFQFDRGIAGVDLNLEIAEKAEGLLCAFQYSTDLFDAETIARMAGHLQTLLAGIVENPQQRVAELPLLTEPERHQLLVEWNNTFTEYPPDQCIHQLFETQVEKTPDDVAVVFENQQLTYRELNAKANQLARYLQALGVGPEILVGICAERSIEMIVGLIGILKAGGAYIPLDPAYPSERLAFMLEDASVSVLLAQEKLVKQLPPHSARVVCLDSNWEEIASYSKDNPSSPVKPENLAYVIYTSGSTGKPKGVLIQHESLVNYTKGAIAEYAIEKRDRVLQFASISFDASAEEIYPCLTSGATLVLRTDSMLDSVGVFLETCRNWNLTVLSLPTAYWHELTAGLSRETLALAPSLRLVIIGSEKALPERLKMWQACVGQQVRLVNTYGPTEATVVATACELSAAEATLRELPIGRPIANVQTYILDRNGQPVPVGVPGELHVGGIGLARGYLNKPELTAEKFIPNPFVGASHSAGERLYKTGDLARYLPDGNIEFLGRIDNQVKIRGFRIELGEIEAVLAQYPAVRDNVVVAREETSGDKRLVAYVVISSEASAAQLREFLKQKLPEYMVPSAFVFLDALPLTSNGKIDRRALPAPDTSRPESAIAFVAPETTAERMLADIWAEVLKLDRVGRSDNFFEVGGHSLLAAQVISRANKAFSVEIPLRRLFETPTVAGLAAAIASLQAESSGDGEMALLLAELEGLSDEEAERLLAAELGESDERTGDF